MGEIQAIPEDINPMDPEPNFFETMEKSWKPVEIRKSCNYGINKPITSIVHLSASCHQNGRYHRCLWFIRFLMDRCEVALEGFTGLAKICSSISFLILETIFLGLVDWAEFLCNFLPAINELDQLVYCVSDEILSKGEDTHCAAKRLCSTMSSITAYSQVLVQVGAQHGLFWLND